jgi:hypothetical protein
MASVRKIAKARILIVLALFIILVVLFPRPMSRSKEELYVTTETYYDEVPQVVNETVLIPYAVNETVYIPYQVVKNMQWNVTWYTLTVSRQWGAAVGTQVFDSTFVYDWGVGLVFGPYSDSIGFRATASFYLEASGLYSFTLGSDDGSKLYIDDTVTVIDLWSDHVFRQNTALWWISTGWHTLTLDYYEWTSTAKIYFNIDKGDLFAWEETQYVAIQVPRIYYNTVQIPRIELQQVPKERTTVANRTVTETVYVNILEYLMKGGKP